MIMHRWYLIKGSQIRSVYQQTSDKCSSLMMNDVRILKAAFVFVFILGITCSVFITLFLDTFRTASESAANTKIKVFHPYPFENHMRNHPESTKESLELSVRKADVEASASTTEALSSLQVALELKSLGKIDKAMKLLEHALALAPKHPDILNHYGEMLEEVNKDIIKADQMYFQALMQCPDHRVARANRQRVKRAVEELDGAALHRIDHKRDTVASIPDSNPALRRAKREAYFQHIYHTVGIEGNTMTLSQTRSIVETRMAVGGKSIVEHNEILGLDAAMKYINSTLINKVGSITVDDILEIHKRVLGFVDPEESGVFRRTQEEPVPPPRPKEVEGWGESLVGKIGQVSGVTVNNVGQPVIFHRGPRVWDARSFNETRDFQQRSQGPIREDTVLILDPCTGKVLSSWGRDLFYMPHGIHVDWEGNTWLTDTALHQAFKFSPGSRRPALTFGQRFKNGDGLRELCMPTSVAVATTGEIFIADGYCNSRILKFDGMGNLIRVFPQKQEFLSLEIPHSLALLEHRDLLCIADRENMRVACIGAKLRDLSPGPGLSFTIQQPDLGRVFGIASHGDMVYAINGQTSPMIPVQGFTLDPLAETILDHWGPTTTTFTYPHAIAISKDGHALYVSEIGPNRVWKFDLRPNYEPNNEQNTF